VSERWEYASVTWVDEVRKITKTDPEFERLPDEVKRKWERGDWKNYPWRAQKIHIWLPQSTEADIRVAWEAFDDDYRVSQLDLFNELGADGWEIASQGVWDSAMGSGYGRDTTSFPIRVRTLLKRRVEG